MRLLNTPRWTQCLHVTAEAVLFSGNGFGAIGVIAALEEDLGRPALTVNQVALWSALRQASVRGCAYRRS